MGSNIEKIRIDASTMRKVAALLVEAQDQDSDVRDLARILAIMSSYYAGKGAVFTLSV